MAETTGVSSAMELEDWNRVAHRRGPKLGLWLLASALAAGGLLVILPIENRWPVLSAIGVVALTVLLFFLGSLAGMRMFAHSCDIYRRTHPTFRLRYLVPLILFGIVGLGLIGSRYWWAFAPVVAFIGDRKGMQRAWWAAVVTLAWSFRSPLHGMPIAATDDEAFAKARDAINER